MPLPIEIRELASRLDEALSSAYAGDEVILTDGAVPRARLVPLETSSNRNRRVPDLHAGAMEASEDFDAPLSDEFWVGRS